MTHIFKCFYIFFFTFFVGMFFWVLAFRGNVSLCEAIKANQTFIAGFIAFIGAHHVIFKWFEEQDEKIKKSMHFWERLYTQAKSVEHQTNSLNDIALPQKATKTDHTAYKQKIKDELKLTIERVKELKEESDYFIFRLYCKEFIKFIEYLIENESCFLVSVSKSLMTGRKLAYKCKEELNSTGFGKKLLESNTSYYFEQIHEQEERCKNQHPWIKKLKSWISCKKQD